MSDQSMQVHSVAAPVRQKVFEMLREAITSGRFRPGQRLIEKDLCDLMGVSRPSVREALRHLESEGLIESMPNRGPVVTKITRQDAVSIYQVRAVLEALAAKLFALNATDQQVEDLEEATRTLGIAIKANNLTEIVAAKDAFYRILLHGGGNVVIPSILGTMNARVTFLRLISLSSPDRGVDTFREIKAAVAAIAQRDTQGAHDAMYDHVTRAAQVALDNLAAYEDAHADDKAPVPARA